MPVLKGLDFLRSLHHPPMVIITSAYQEYALESYELNVIDYLLKPFDFNRFLKAFNKALHHQKMQEALQGSNTQQATQTVQDDRIFIKSDKKIHQLHLNQILFLESAGSYVKIYMEAEMFMILERLSHFENLLPSKQFMRVHKSFIVSINKIRTISGNRILIAEHEIPIGQTYKLNLKKLLM